VITGRSGVTSTVWSHGEGCTPSRAVDNSSKSKAGSPTTPTSGFGRENRVKPSSDDLLLVEKLTDVAG
jgi:hypothetical protein